MATTRLRSRVLWQDGYHERTLRRDEHRLIVATNIVNNPVRAGLVSSWQETPQTGGTLVDPNFSSGVATGKPELKFPAYVRKFRPTYGPS